MNQNPRGVSDDFEREPDYHADAETPCLKPSAQADLWEDKGAEEDRKEEVRAVWLVVSMG